MGPKELGHIKTVKTKLTAVFEMIDIGPICFYLRLKVGRDRQKRLLKLSQPTYIAKISEKYHLHLAKPYNIPMKKSILLLDKRPEVRQAMQERY